MEQLVVVQKVKHILDLSKTDLAIISTLSRDQKLLVSEIAHQTNRSQRHICDRLSLLLKKGILERELFILQNKRLAYRYSLLSTDKITERLRKYLLQTLADLDTVCPTR
jgi:predicted DNA-binding transcriptional regulator